MPILLKSYCVGHTQPHFTPTIDYVMLCPSAVGAVNELIVQDDRFGSEIDGASLAEYSQLFGLCDLLEAGDIVADRLFLFQYRKFISPKVGGQPSMAPWIKILSPQEGAAVFPSMEYLEDKKNRSVVGSVFEMGESIASNYARVHVVDDFAMFVAACAKSTKMSDEDIRSFIGFKGFIPSPALCLIDADIFFKIMNVMQQVWQEFRKYIVKREGYQRRVAGYLFERLHSYLLCKWLLDGSEPDVMLWNRYVVSDALA